MANDARQFNVSLDDFARRVGLSGTTVAKRVAFDLFGRIVRKTPVDTGRARASWNISTNQADRSVVESVNLVGAGGEKVFVFKNRKSLAQQVIRMRGARYITKAEARHATKKTVSGRAMNAIRGLDVRPGDEIWISNNLPYIVELEKGHSKQAPQGMVALSIGEVQLAMNRLEREGLRDAGL
jgi:hypothetical protein